ncbi:hypothetical protein [Singulisphaera sp. PoT]|uniref:hypothetical protein n=1 Tax=Singulisphaera sp. PoT TaxID=3411797 RepID=UPI003BF4BA35
MKTILIRRVDLVIAVLALNFGISSLHQVRAEDWLTPEESRFFKMFGYRILKDSRWNTVRPDFRHLPALAAEFPNPLSERMKSMLRAIREANPSDDELSRIQVLSKFLATPDQNTVLRMRNAMSGGLIGMMFGADESAFARGMTDSALKVLNDQNVRQAEAIEEINRIIESYQVRAHDASRIWTDSVKAIIDEVCTERGALDGERVDMKIVSTKKGLCLELTAVNQDLVSPVVVIEIARKPIETGRLTFSENRPPERERLTPPPLQDLVLIPQVLKPKHPVLIGLGVPSAFTSAIEKIGVRVICEDEWIDVDEVAPGKRTILEKEPAKNPAESPKSPDRPDPFKPGGIVLLKNGTGKVMGKSLSNYLEYELENGTRALIVQNSRNGSVGVKILQGKLKGVTLKVPVADLVQSPSDDENRVGDVQ